MTLKIDKIFVGPKTIIRLSGRLQAEHIDALNTHLGGSGNQPRIELDLDGVTLVDVEVVRFLNDCEDSGIELLYCCPYIREWMVREKVRQA